MKANHRTTASTTTSQGWGTWDEDRRYPAKDGEHMITVYKRTQRYGTDEKCFGRTPAASSPSRNAKACGAEVERVSC